MPAHRIHNGASHLAPSVRERGFALTEVIVAAIILILVSGAFLQLVAASSKAQSTEKVRQQQQAVTEAFVEQIRVDTKWASACEQAQGCRPIKLGERYKTAKFTEIPGTEDRFDISKSIATAVDSPADGTGTTGANADKDGNTVDFYRVETTIVPPSALKGEVKDLVTTSVVDPYGSGSMGSVDLNFCQLPGQTDERLSLSTCTKADTWMPMAFETAASDWMEAAAKNALDLRGATSAVPGDGCRSVDASVVCDRLFMRVQPLTSRTVTITSDDGSMPAKTYTTDAVTGQVLNVKLKPGRYTVTASVPADMELWKTKSAPESKIVVQPHDDIQVTMAYRKQALGSFKVRLESTVGAKPAAGTPTLLWDPSRPATVPVPGDQQIGIYRTVSMKLIPMPGNRAPITAQATATYTPGGVDPATGNPTQGTPVRELAFSPTTKTGLYPGLYKPMIVNGGGAAEPLFAFGDPKYDDNAGKAQYSQLEYIWIAPNGNTIPLFETRPTGPKTDWNNTGGATPELPENDFTAVYTAPRYIVEVEDEQLEPKRYTPSVFDAQSKTFPRPPIFQNANTCVWRTIPKPDSEYRGAAERAIYNQLVADSDANTAARAYRLPETITTPEGNIVKIIADDGRLVQLNTDGSAVLDEKGNEVFRPEVQELIKTYVPGVRSCAPCDNIRVAHQSYDSYVVIHCGDRADCDQKIHFSDGSNGGLFGGFLNFFSDRLKGGVVNVWCYQDNSKTETVLNDHGRPAMEYGAWNWRTLRYESQPITAPACRQGTQLVRNAWEWNVYREGGNGSLVEGSTDDPNTRGVDESSRQFSWDTVLNLFGGKTLHSITWTDKNNVTRKTPALTVAGGKTSTFSCMPQAECKQELYSSWSWGDTDGGAANVECHQQSTCKQKMTLPPGRGSYARCYPSSKCTQTADAQFQWGMIAPDEVEAGDLDMNVPVEDRYNSHMYMECHPDSTCKQNVTRGSWLNFGGPVKGNMYMVCREDSSCNQNTQVATMTKGFQQLCYRGGKCTQDLKMVSVLAFKRQDTRHYSRPTQLCYPLAECNQSLYRTSPALALDQHCAPPAPYRMAPGREVGACNRTDRTQPLWFLGFLGLIVGVDLSPEQVCPTSKDHAPSCKMGFYVGQQLITLSGRNNNLQMCTSTGVCREDYDRKSMVSAGVKSVYQYCIVHEPVQPTAPIMRRVCDYILFLFPINCRMENQSANPEGWSCEQNMRIDDTWGNGSGDYDEKLSTRGSKRYQNCDTQGKCDQTLHMAGWPLISEIIGSIFGRESYVLQSCNYALGRPGEDSMETPPAPSGNYGVNQGTGGA